MLHYQPADVVFTLLIGALTVTLAFLTLREDWLRGHGR
jgi:hypothetical protein